MSAAKAATHVNATAAPATRIAKIIAQIAFIYRDTRSATAGEGACRCGLNVEVIESRNAERPAVRCIAWLDGWRRFIAVFASAHRPDAGTQDRTAPPLDHESLSTSRSSIQTTGSSDPSPRAQILPRRNQPCHDRSGYI